jgi:hypothetical protein
VFVLPATRSIRQLVTVALAALFAAGCASAPRAQQSPSAAALAARPTVGPTTSPATTAAPTVWAPSSAGPIDETHLAVVQRLDIPGDGSDTSLWEAGGDLWTQDRADRVVTNGIPEGEMYRIDPHTGKVKAVIEGVIGGCGVASDEALWLCTSAGDLDVVNRIDLETNTVYVIRDGLGPGTEPEAIAVTDDAVWIGSNQLGTVQRYDKRTLEPTDSLQVTPAGHGGLRSAVAVTADGKTAWFGTGDKHEVVRIDLDGIAVDGRVTLPTGPTNGVALVDGTLWAWATEHLYQLDPTTDDPVILRDVATPGTDLRVGASDDGSLAMWAGLSSPPRLLQVDPTTLAITKRAVVDNPEPGDEELGFGEHSGSWWGRKDGEVVKLEPR